MMILRVIVFLSALLIALSGVMYLLTQDKSYLKFAWQVARFVFYALLIFVLLFILERYLLIGWRSIV